MTGTPRTTALTFAFHDHPKPCSLKKSESCAHVGTIIRRPAALARTGIRLGSWFVMV